MRQIPPKVHHHMKLQTKHNLQRLPKRIATCANPTTTTYKSNNTHTFGVLPNKTCSVWIFVVFFLHSSSVTNLRHKAARRPPVRKELPDFVQGNSQRARLSTYTLSGLVVDYKEWIFGDYKIIITHKTRTFSASIFGYKQEEKTRVFVRFVSLFLLGVLSLSVSL